MDAEQGINGAVLVFNPSVVLHQERFIFSYKFLLFLNWWGNCDIGVTLKEFQHHSMTMGSQRTKKNNASTKSGGKNIKSRMDVAGQQSLNFVLAGNLRTPFPSAYLA